jgi:catalase|tara:strand:- start:9408 stop:9647 length:240 start_codon:yes stop_codon:yes gene_type:complete
MHTIKNRFVHGPSFIIHMDSVDFMTWRMNEDSGEYWVKFHFGTKEVRVRVTPNELKELVAVWANKDIDIKIGEKNDMDY